MKTRLSRLAVLAVLEAVTGCQTRQQLNPIKPAPAALVLEREFPSDFGEPVYLLKPSRFPVSDMMAVWMPRPPLPSPKGGIASVIQIGPEDTSSPTLSKASRATLEEIVDAMPPYLPKRAIFLISSKGVVIEVALAQARDQLNERVFAARLRALDFSPATYGGRPIAVICEVDLTNGLVGPKPI